MPARQAFFSRAIALLWTSKTRSVDLGSSSRSLQTGNQNRFLECSGEVTGNIGYIGTRSVEAPCSGEVPEALEAAKSEKEDVEAATAEGQRRGVVSDGGDGGHQFRKGGGSMLQVGSPAPHICSSREWHQVANPLLTRWSRSRERSTSARMSAVLQSFRSAWRGTCRSRPPMLKDRGLPISGQYSLPQRLVPWSCLGHCFLLGGGSGDLGVLGGRGVEHLEAEGTYDDEGAGGKLGQRRVSSDR